MTTTISSAPRRGFTALLMLGIFAASVSLLSACGSSDDKGDSISLQLDWTPNTNHIGIYVALANGWYKDAGLDVDILPYSDINPDVVVANGQADFGISFPQSLIFSRAAGLDLVSVAAVLQHTVSEFAVLDSSDIKRPRDFDGKLYAGFGAPYEEPQIRTVIKADGGKGEFQTAVLSTAAYEALYNKRADFAEIFTAWEGIEASLRGFKLRTFKYSDYGVPDIYSVILIAKQSNITKNAADYRKFLDVTRRGYEFAAQQPAEAARLMIKEVGADAFPNPPEVARDVQPGEIVRRSAAMLAPVLVGTDGKWGAQTSAAWTAYSGWLVGSGVVTDAQDKPVTALPGGPLFDNELLTSTTASAGQ